MAGVQLGQGAAGCVGLPEYTETKADPKDPTKVSFSDGTGYLVKSFAQMVQQIEAGATVINWSQGPKEPSPDNEWKAGIYRKFLETMYKKYPQVVFVAAAGNEAGGLNGKNYDIGGLKLPNVITVGALGEDGNTASFSNFATGDGEVTIAADGTNVFMGYGADGKPVNGSGTSFSTPQVTATVAVLQSINPNLTAQDIKKILVESGGSSVTVDNKSVPIANNLSGRVLRVDDAVLRVINDVRKAKGLAPLTKELLDKLGTVDASADAKNPKEYTIKASLGAVGEKPADVKVEVMGEGMLSGNSTKQLTAPGDLTWGLTLLDEKKGPTVKLTRLDTGACATIDLNPVDIAGLWTGSWTLTDAKVYSDVSIPDPLDPSKPPTVIKKEECESQFMQQKGKPVKATLEFTPESPQAGKMVMTIIDQKGKEQKEKPWGYQLSGNSVVIQASESGGTIKMEGQVSQEGKEDVMKGTIRMTLENKGVKMLDMQGVFSVSKPVQ
ncbi:MAG: S8 family serine peptidase [Chloroflexi bacterium]|nr:S8 family serine peptidase [Chloroflexota bacterium]